jgi:hypothetical protein
VDHCRNKIFVNNQNVVYHGFMGSWVHGFMVYHGFSFLVEILKVLSDLSIHWKL